MPHLPFRGDFKSIPKNETGEPADEFETMSLAMRLGISIEEMKEMSFVSLYNILISATNMDEEKEASQNDIERMFG